MKTIKLDSLKIHNFKGIRDFELKAEGEPIAVSGANAIGKTTIFDAFTWLLFGKNSEDAKKFNVKPLDDQGSEVLGLEPEVEATFEIDGQQKTLRRVLKENWVKPKGQLEKQRKPDTTKLYIDDVPQKLKEYTEYINSLINEDTFKMITNPAAFTSLHWEKQRNVLTDIAGELSDQEIIKADNKLKELSELLGDHSVAEQKKIVASQKRQIKKDIESIPSRIDEAERAKPELINTPQPQLREIAETYKLNLSKAREDIVQAQNTDATVELALKKDQLQSSLQVKKNNFDARIQLKIGGLKEDYDKQLDKQREAKQIMDNVKLEFLKMAAFFDGLKEDREDLLKQYHAEKEIKFDEGSTVCEMCGQPLPADKVEEIKDSFNQKHSEKLADILAKGKEEASKIKEYEKKFEDAKAKSKKLEVKFNDAKQHADELKQELDAEQAQLPVFEDSQEYQDTQKQIADIEEQINGGQASNDKAIQEAQAKVSDIENKLEKVQVELRKYEQVNTQDQRIKELEDEEANLKQKFNELDKTEYLIDQFTRTKVSMLEKLINKRFKLVSFKLFNLQKNGELDETCEALVDGVPYSDLNNAARINAGLDIINTLSNYYQVQAPIFIDNAESVNDILETEAQQIALVVTKAKKLTVKAA